MIMRVIVQPSAFSGQLSALKINNQQLKMAISIDDFETFWTGFGRDSRNTKKEKYSLLLK
jgi:hypothetical protein